MTSIIIQIAIGVMFGWMLAEVWKLRKTRIRFEKLCNEIEKDIENDRKWWSKLQDKSND